MKYEMIFGDAGLFDGAPDDAEYAGWFCQEIRWYMILNGKILFSDGGTWCTSDNPYLSADIAAMRRIIKEPKRWTWEDKKDGVLPDVGSIFTYRDETLTCNFIDGDGEIWAHDIYNKIVTPLLRDCKPIETAREKYDRERDEWVNSLRNKLPPLNMSFINGMIKAYEELKPFTGDDHPHSTNSNHTHG